MFSAFLGDVINIFEAATGSDPLRRARLADVRVEGRSHVRVRPPHHRRGRGEELRAQQARLLPVRAGLVVHGLQHHGRAEPARPRHAARHRRLGPGAAPVRRRRSTTSTHARRLVRPHPLEPRRPVVGHRRGARRPLLRPGQQPLRRHPARRTPQRAAALDRRGAAKLAALSAMVVDGRLEMELPLELERHRAGTQRARQVERRHRRRAACWPTQTLYAAALDASARQCATGERWPAKPLDGGGAGHRRQHDPALVEPDHHRAAERARLPCAGRPGARRGAVGRRCWSSRPVRADGAGLRLRVEPIDAPLEQVELHVPAARRRAPPTPSSAARRRRPRWPPTADGTAPRTSACPGPIDVEVRPS